MIMDERNRNILELRWERHVRGLAMSRLMMMDGRNRKPYTHRQLKNKPIPMPDQGLEWVPTLTKPLIDLNPPVVRFTVYGKAT